MEFSPYSLPENPTRQDPIPADGIQLGRSCPKQSPECGCISSPARAVGYCSRPQRIGNGPFRMAGDEAASSTDETFATTATGIFPRGPSGGSSCLKFAVLIGLGIVPRSLASHVENMLERPAPEHGKPTPSCFLLSNASIERLRTMLSISRCNPRQDRCARLGARPTDDLARKAPRLPARAWGLVRVGIRRAPLRCRRSSARRDDRCGPYRG